MLLHFSKYVFVCICYLIASSIPNFLEPILDMKKKLKSKKPVADGGKAGSKYKGQVHVAILMFLFKKIK